MALDTNGQNARFVRAAEKHGASEKVLEILALGHTDPAGVVARFAVAGEMAGLRIRSAHKAQPYFRFPIDILWDGHSQRQVRELAKAADVIHLNNTWRAYTHLGLVHKPALLHHHGSLLRSDPEKMMAVAKRYRMTQAVSTIDLTRYAPDELHWLPTAYDIDALAAMRPAKRRAGPIRIVHCPTNRALKATDTFMRAVGALQATGVSVEAILVEGKTNAEVLAIKADADIVFDQLAYGYGCNAVEAWAMSVPVISGADDWTLGAMEKRFGGSPFFLADEHSLRSRILELVESPALRKEWGAIGRAHVERYHAERPAIERLAELYALTIKRRHSRAVIEQVGPVTFRNPRGMPIYWQNDDGRQERIRFPDGEATFTDPMVIERLRHVIATRPLWKIEEIRP